MADQTRPPRSAQAASGAAAPRMAPMAIVSVVLGVLSFLCIPIIPVIPAIVCGHVAWSKINKSGGALQGKGIAIVGLIVGYLAIPWASYRFGFSSGWSRESVIACRISRLIGKRLRLRTP